MQKILKRKINAKGKIQNTKAKAKITKNTTPKTKNTETKKIKQQNKKYETKYKNRTLQKKLQFFRNLNKKINLKIKFNKNCIISRGKVSMDDSVLIENLTQKPLLGLRNLT